MVMNITAGIFKGRKITAPDEKITRPTLSKVRMSVFNTLHSMIEFEGSSFLDMYAGSGIMGLEALSRGFSEAVAFEKHPKAAQIIKINYKKFNPSPELIQGDALKLAEKINRNFDVIYIDPPYFSGVYEASLNAVKRFTKAVIILEHVTEIDFKNFNILKQKKYGDKYVTFLQLNSNINSCS